MGLTQRIRDLLAQGPKTRLEIADALGLNVRAVGSQLNRGVTSGYFYGIPRTSPRQYGLNGALEKPQRNPALVAPRTPPEFRTRKADPTEAHRRLAESIRK